VCIEQTLRPGVGSIAAATSPGRLKVWNLRIWQITCALVPSLYPQEKSLTMIILGIILLLIGYFTSLSILYTIGAILVVVGVILWILGAVGRPVGGRKVWF
jgi:hypothetical protein